MEGIGPVFLEVAAVRHYPDEIGQHYPGEGGRRFPDGIGQHYPGEGGRRFPDGIGQHYLGEGGRRFPVALTLGGPRGQRCHVEVERRYLGDKPPNC